MRDLLTGVLIICCVFAFAFGFALAFGVLMRGRTERVIEICVTNNIPPEKCIEIGDKIYGQ